jgi:glyoxylase-like metal-dependent hydrolase (beta-lactamase superfamily II)
MQAFALVFALVVGLGQARGQSDPFTFDFTELAPGVWAGVRPDVGRTPVMGSATFVISDAGVVVFDGGGVPLMSERLIEKIRALTELPVTHVVISHWHGDHNFGISSFRDEFPGVEIVAHEFTYEAMTRGKTDYIHRRPGAVPPMRERYLARIESGLDLEGDPLPESVLLRMAEFVDDSDLIHSEYNRLELTLPTMSFRESLTIHSGSRRIELLFLGAGNTAGDLVMWLPEERVVAAGDLVVHPTPYGFNVPPRAWADTLGRLNALDYDVLVPGHGELQYDTRYVDLLIEVCESLVAQRDALVAAGVPSEEAQAQLDFTAFEPRFTGGDPESADLFFQYFERPMRSATFKELTGEPMVALD